MVIAPRRLLLLIEQIHFLLQMQLCQRVQAFPYVLAKQVHVAINNLRYYVNHLHVNLIRFFLRQVDFLLKVEAHSPLLFQKLHVHSNLYFRMFHLYRTNSYIGPKIVVIQNLSQFLLTLTVYSLC